MTRRAVDAFSIAILIASGGMAVAAADIVAGLAVADVAIDELSSEPAERIGSILGKRKSYRTPYVVLRLLDWCDEKYMLWTTDFAVAVTGAAVDISRSIEPRIPVLCCRAEKELGNALADAGRYREADAALLRAGHEALQTQTPELNLAAVRMATAKLRAQTGRLNDALDLVRQAKKLYLRSCQPSVAMSGRTLESAILLEAAILLDLGHYSEAREKFSDLHSSAEERGDEVMIAIQISNVAHCDVMLGDVAAARERFAVAAELFESLEMAAPSARMLRSLGRISIRESGSTIEMDEALSEFDRLGMPDEWIMTQLAIAEEMASRGNHEAVESACREAYGRATIFQLEVAAAEALAKLHDAAVQGKATREMIGTVTASINLLATRREQPSAAQVVN